MRFGLIFCVLAALLIASGWLTECKVSSLLHFYAALSCAGLATGYLLRRPGVLLKRSDGRLSLASWMLFAPYHVFNHVFLEVFRRASRKPKWTEVVPGLWLGGRLRSWDRQSLNLAANFSVLDVTGEFAEVPWLRSGAAYRCVPLLDTTAPTKDQLRHGVAFVRERLPLGPVYVHCAFGHSRSATFIAAFLVDSGRCKDANQAVTLMQSRRPRVRLNGEQMQALGEYVDSLRPG